MNKNIMRLYLCLGLVVLSACGAKKSGIKMGETTRADVIAEKGEPLSEETPPVKNTTIMNYDDNEKIQLKGEIVTNRFTNPLGDEKLLLWWKHKFKDCSGLKKSILAQHSKAHTSPEIELSCPEQGLSIIYTEGSDTVSRVVENEK